MFRNQTQKTESEERQEEKEKEERKYGGLSDGYRCYFCGQEEADCNCDG